MSLLAVDNLSVSFGDPATARRVVDGVSFTLEPGEKFALVGESGSGKTVTALSILRLLQANIEGRIAFNGLDLSSAPERTLRGIRGKEIALIFQEPMSALNPLYTIGNQIMEVLELHEGLSARDARVRGIELLRQTGIPEPERRFDSFPHQLSGGQRQRAMIAMALACRPKLLIADEPTTALDVTLRAQIMDLLDSLQQQYGMAVMLITHDLNLVRRFAQRVGVMQQGRLVELAATDELFASPKAEYTRRLLASRPEALALQLPQADTSVPPLLRAERVQAVFPIRKGWFRKDSFKAVEQVDLHLQAGETLGIVGESGSGKSTLGMALLRLSVAQVAGKVQFDGRPLSEMADKAVRPLRSRMQVVFQDPFASLSPRRTVEQTVAEGLALHQPQLSSTQLQQAVAAALEEVGLAPDMMVRYPHEFSGGQRQRIAIARALVLKPSLILLDEPTSSLDVSVQQQVLRLLSDLQRRYGLAYLFISHDLAVIRAMAHRVMVMKDGRVVESGATAEVLSNPQDPYTRRLLAASVYAVDAQAA
jgi:microcin C transport system ATP-binding protein